MSIFDSHFDKIEARVLNDKAHEHAKQLHEDEVKTHQLRSFFSGVEKIRRDFNRDKIKEYNKYARSLMYLKIKAAYAAGRQIKTVGKNFFSYMDNAIDAVDKAEDNIQALENYFFYIEGIIAYHKFEQENSKK